MAEQDRQPLPTERPFLRLLRDPLWGPIGVLATILLSVIGFYFATQNVLWLYITAMLIIIMVLLGGYEGALHKKVLWYIVAMFTSLLVAFVSGSFGGPQIYYIFVRPPIPNTQSLSIKSMPSLYVNAYGDADNKSFEGDNEFYSHLVVLQKHDGNPGYKLSYRLPNDGFGYAGFQFTFSNPQNLKGYEFIDVDIEFGDDSTGCQLKMIDNAGESKYTRILGPNQTFRIPIETATDGVNLEAIKSVEFIVLTDFSRGRHDFTVNDVHFVRSSTINDSP